MLNSERHAEDRSGSSGPSWHGLTALADQVRSRLLLFNVCGLVLMMALIGVQCRFERPTGQHLADPSTQIEHPVPLLNPPFIARHQIKNGSLKSNSGVSLNDLVWNLESDSARRQIRHASAVEAGPNSGLLLRVQGPGACLNPHPGPFRAWNGQMNGCMVQVWRQWPDSCTHFQWFNSCAQVWDPQIYWTRCVH